MRHRFRFKLPYRVTPFVLAAANVVFLFYIMQDKEFLRKQPIAFILMIALLLLAMVVALVVFLFTSTIVISDEDISQELFGFRWMYICWDDIMGIERSTYYNPGAMTFRPLYLLKSKRKTRRIVLSEGLLDLQGALHLTQERLKLTVLHEQEASSSEHL